MLFNIGSKHKNKQGVYSITNIINGKRYVGSTGRSFYSRFHQHIYDYKKGKKSIKALYRAFDKYGIENFIFSVLVVCNPKDCIKKEQQEIDNGCEYNSCPIAGSMLGYKHPENSKTKTVKGSSHHCAKKIYQFSLSGELIKKHYSIIEAITDIGKTKNASSHLVSCCNGKTFSSFGFRWSFSDVVIDRRKRKSQTCIAVSNENYYRVFYSQVDAALFFNEIGYLQVKQSAIGNAIKRKNKLYNHKIEDICVTT